MCGCPNRRAVLRAGGMAAGGAALLAACGTDDDSAEDASIAGGETLADLSELDVGSSLSVQTSAGQTVLLTRLDEEQVVAFSAVCTHQGCTVEEIGRASCRERV